MAITKQEENPYQDDMKWTVIEVSDMCIPDDPVIKNTVDDMADFDENTWEILDQQSVKEADNAEIARFWKMGVYFHVSRSEALNDPHGSFVKVKCVRTNKGTAAQPNIRCRFVAQELVYGQWIDELFSGTLSLMSTKLAIVHADKGRRATTVRDVMCAFLHGVCRLRIYIELARQDPKHGVADPVGQLHKAMYGTRDAAEMGKRGTSCHGELGLRHRCSARGRLLVLWREKGVGVAFRQLGTKNRTKAVTDYEGF